jgi:hypothetical protein
LVPPLSGAVSPKLSGTQFTLFEKKPGAVMLQLPLPSKPMQAARRTSREPLKLQTSFRFAQKVPPGGVNGVPLEDELDEELVEELLELDEEELLLELEDVPPPQPIAEPDTTISSIHTSAL